jgi:transcription antitermination protein NusB
MSEPAGPDSDPVRRGRSSRRHKARKRALDILFEAELRGVDPIATLEERAAAADPPIREYTTKLVRGVVAHAGEIDARISACLAPGGTVPRIPRVDRTALRIAVFEIDYGEVPDAVAVSEAVQLVSELSTEDSPAFVNGVLGAVATSRVG